MEKIFIPDITNIIISFFDLTQQGSVKTILDFLSLTRNFIHMKNITDEKFLRKIFFNILNGDAKNNKKIYSEELIKNILKVVKPEIYSNYAIKKAAENNHFIIVKLLLENKNIGYTKYWEDGVKTKDFKYLLKYTNRSESNEDEKSSTESNDESDNSDDDSKYNYSKNYSRHAGDDFWHPLLIACKNSNEKIVELLLKDKRFNKKKYVELSLNIASLSFYENLETQKLLFNISLLNVVFSKKFINEIFKKEKNVAIFKHIFSYDHPDIEKELTKILLLAANNYELDLFKFLVNHKSFSFAKCKYIFKNINFRKIDNDYYKKILHEILEIIFSEKWIEHFDLDDFFFRNCMNGNKCMVDEFLNYEVVYSNKKMKHIVERLINKGRESISIFIITHKNICFDSFYKTYFIANLLRESSLEYNDLTSIFDFILSNPSVFDLKTSTLFCNYTVKRFIILCCEIPDRYGIYDMVNYFLNHESYYSIWEISDIIKFFKHHHKYHGKIENTELCLLFEEKIEEISKRTKKNKNKNEY